MLKSTTSWLTLDTAKSWLVNITEQSRGVVTQAKCLFMTPGWASPVLGMITHWKVSAAGGRCDTFELGTTDLHEDRVLMWEGLLPTMVMLIPECDLLSSSNPKKISVSEKELLDTVSSVSDEEWEFIFLHSPSLARRYKSALQLLNQEGA